MNGRESQNSQQKTKQERNRRKQEKKRAKQRRQSQARRGAVTADVGRAGQVTEKYRQDQGSIRGIKEIMTIDSTTHNSIAKFFTAEVW